MLLSVKEQRISVSPAPSRAHCSSSGSPAPSRASGRGGTPELSACRGGESEEIRALVLVAMEISCVSLLLLFIYLPWH